MRPSPLISVIVPIHDVAGHLAPCLDSLRGQSLDDFECLMVDDGSTDGSGAIAEAVAAADPRFTLIAQENAGLSAARNAGLDWARGDFIAFVDGDDRVMPDYLAQLHAALAEAGADWVACAVASVLPDGTGHSHSAIHDAPDLSAHGAPRLYPLETWPEAVRHFPSAWNKLYRADLVEGLRFDEGVWFEDHGFFQRVAARTNHILHLPQALYLQTRGRAGQITAADDDRVFQQFDVLEGLRAGMAGGKPGAEEAFEVLASRLVFERSTALRDPDRRARFAEAARDFLERHGLAYRPGAEGLAWGLEMAGDLPLSLVLHWDGRDRAALDATLEALRGRMGPAAEILLSAPRGTPAPAGVILPEGTGLQAALDTARGRFVAFLEAGDTPGPAAYLQATDLLLREEADLAVMAFRDASRPGTPGHDGLADPGAFPQGTPATGALEVSPAQALALHPCLPAKLFRRDFLAGLGVPLSDRPRGHWAAVLAAALTGRVAYLAPTVIRVARPWGAPGPLGAGHAALLRQLPKTCAEKLPQGWQRRLFARALRARADMAESRADRARLALAATLSGLRFGMLGRRVDPAGFDPGVGPGLGRLMAPLAALRGQVFDPRAAQDAPAHVFPCAGRGLLRLQADFQDHDYANLSLTGALPDPTPFHLSLRRREGLAVVNDRRGDGRWRAERRVEIALPRAGAEVILRIAAPRLGVEIDGREVFALSRRLPWRRGGLRGLSRIAGLELEGGFRLVDALPAPLGPALALDARLQLLARLPEGTAAGACRVQTGHGPALPVTALPGGGAQAALPGRVWQDLAPDAALELRLTGPEGAIGPALTLTRADMARHAAALLARNPAPEDSGAVLVLLEHCADAAIWAHLPEAAQARARRLAGFYKLTAGLPPGAPPPVPAPDPRIAAIDAALARFGQAMAADPAPDPLAVLDALALPDPQARQGLLLALSEVFCREGMDTAGFAARARGLPPFTPADEVWTDSAMLPFLALSDDPAGLENAAAVMTTLVPLTEDWVLTPPIAFMMRHALADRRLDTATRDTILYAAMEFVRQRTGDYWERAHCAELTGAAVALLCARDRLPWYMVRDVEWFCLHHYGLSRLFWERLARDWPADGPDTAPLPPLLGLARDAFAALQAARAAGDRAGIAAALERFGTLGAVELPRLRRELLGPASLPLAPGEAPSATALLTQPDPGLSALRHMAFPGAAAPGAEVARMVHETLPDLLPGLARAPLPDRQRMLARAARSVLETPSDAAQAALIDLALELGDAGSAHIGIAVLLAVIGARPDDTAPLQDALAAHLAQLPGAVAGMTRAPAVRNAATRVPAPVLARLLPGLPADPAPVPAENPLYDVIVVVFSCKPYLDSRIPSLRAGWLSLLKDLGIPHIVVVGDGDGDGRQEGDVVHLDAPDDYEGLPQKTLAAIRWVRDNTPHGHMFKVDDDCFLNAPLFFESLNWRKADYHGRRLTRVPGQMDRAWHQAKSASPRGRLEFDRSPEPSSYTDGGSGYALSRHAMDAALEMADSPEGQRLIAASFMEDKLLGDLLSLAGIAAGDEDYRVSVFRRTHRDAIPVASWQNSFLPSAAAPVMLAHLDTHEGQEEAVARLGAPVLHPPKIWPSFQPPLLGYQTNALELVSDVASTRRAAEAEVAVVACMRNEMFMLPAFLAHYRRLGVGAFLVADNGSDDGTLEYLADQPDVALFSVDTDYNRSRYGVAWQQALLAGFRQGKWSLVADADELLVWQKEQRQTLPELLATPDFARAEAARIFMLDMYPQGPLENATFASGDPFAEAGFADRTPFLTHAPTWGPYTDRPCRTSALRHRLIPGSRPNLFVAQKLALLKYHPFMRLSAGLHFVGDVALSPRELIFAHFKYNSDFRRKAAAEVARGQHWGDAAEYRKYLALSSEGRSVIFEPGLSVPWQDAPFVAARLD